MGVRAWLAPVAPLKALAAHRWAKPHLRYFSMRRAAGEQQDLVTRWPWRTGAWVWAVPKMQALGCRQDSEIGHTT